MKFSIPSITRKPSSLITTLLRWSVLPDMPSARNAPSALSVGQNEDDIAILVVGGIGFGDDRYVEMLVYCPAHGNENPWKWRMLAPLLEERLMRPGMLLLSDRKVVVVGGRGDGEMAEVFRLPRDDSDPGQWTLIKQAVPVDLCFAFFVSFKGRLLICGKA